MATNKDAPSSKRVSWTVSIAGMLLGCVSHPYGANCVHWSEPQDTKN